MNQDELNKHLKEEKRLVVVDFHAIWCGPCKKLMPVLEKMVDEHDLCLLKVDVDESEEFSDHYEVITIPTLLFFKNGELLDKLVSSDENDVLQLILKHK